MKRVYVIIVVAVAACSGLQLQAMGASAGRQGFMQGGQTLKRWDSPSRAAESKTLFGGMSRQGLGNLENEPSGMVTRRDAGVVRMRERINALLKELKDSRFVLVREIARSNAKRRYPNEMPFLDERQSCVGNALMRIEKQLNAMGSDADTRSNRIGNLPALHRIYQELLHYERELQQIIEAFDKIYMREMASRFETQAADMASETTENM